MTSTLPGLLDYAVAVAGSRAGALGVLDLTFCSDSQQAVSAASALSRHAGGDIGVRVRSSEGELLSEVHHLLPQNRATTIILVPENIGQLPEIAWQIKSAGWQFLVECVSIEEAELGTELGADGLIAKGNEAGGRVSEETTFIFLQKLCSLTTLPVWAHGGVSLHNAVSCLLAGAIGVVLDSQLVFARECRLAESDRHFLNTQDGTGSRILGEELAHPYRFLATPGSALLETLIEEERHLFAEREQNLKVGDSWQQSIFHLMHKQYGKDNGGQRQVFLIGQDLCFARNLAEKHVTVGGIVQALNASVAQHYRLAGSDNPFAGDRIWEKDHQTEFSIVQGPMARVSDNPAFAKSVADNGALPMLAAAWSSPDELDTLCRDTRAKLGEKPWGIGLLGFLPVEVYNEQVSVVLKYRPRFVLLAGGQIHQAKELEEEGIRTYVHVPSAVLLDMFLEAGLRRFVFEGREAGGHVGPLSSFILWETAIERLLKHAKMHGSLKDFHLLFAGGIHNAASAAMIEVMSSPLRQYDAAIGLQVGSAYLFTNEIVATGAIVETYQEQVKKCTATALMETSPGHVVRSVRTPFVARFQEEKRKLLTDKQPFNEVRNTLVKLEQGRLRIAAKGLKRDASNSQSGERARLVELPVATQYEEGSYLVGQIAALRSEATTISALHKEIAIDGHTLTKRRINQFVRPVSTPRQKPSDIAVIGMAGFFPGSDNTADFWSNIINKVVQIREIPKERWDYTAYFDEDRQAVDRIYSKWGTFLDDVPFDPLKFGMPPLMVSSVEPLHLLVLESVHRALADAGYDKRPFDRENTAVVMGISGVGDLAQMYSFRTMLPMFFASDARTLTDRFDHVLPSWTEDSFPGILMNVAAGRVSNRFDLGGMNGLVDGACASSLAALYSAVKELETGACNMAVVGGADCMQNQFTYMCFAKTHALSPRGVCNCLDARADGIVIGEAVVNLILKRLKDAERDGDRIYGVIKGMGASSDGKGRSLTAPSVRGQTRALNRAYAKANISPTDIELYEAHATGTVEGDKIEIESMTGLLTSAGAPPSNCAIGSIKSMIGHSKSTAGLASLAKTFLSLHHQILPPTSGVETPNPGLQKENTPLYANVDARPWFTSNKRRLAGVSAFGFGGTNYHAVLEEYTGNYYEVEKPASYQQWGTELFSWQASTADELLASLDKAVEGLSRGASGHSLLELAYNNHLENAQSIPAEDGMSRIAIVADSLTDLLTKLEKGRSAVAAGKDNIADPAGLFYSTSPLGITGKTAFLFPGQGSQYVNMLRELTLQFPWLKEPFGRSDELLSDRLAQRLTSYIFPPSVFTEDKRKEQAKQLADTTKAQPAMGTADLSMYRLCRRLGMQPDMVAGHSYGEYVALCVAGVFAEDDLIQLSEARARYILKAAGDSPGSMAAVSAAIGVVEDSVASLDNVWIANINGPEQVVITGTTGAIEDAVARFGEKNITARKIPVSCAFHSPLVAAAGSELKAHLDGIAMRSPEVPVYSNTTAVPHVSDTAEICETLERHLANRVCFSEQIENMYRDGARIFVECGPNRVLTGLVAKILQDKPHAAIAMDTRGGSSLSQLQHCMAQLLVNGIELNCAPLYAGRRTDNKRSEIAPTSWYVNGSRVRQARQDEKPVKIEPFVLAQQGSRSAPVSDTRIIQPSTPASAAPASAGTDNIMVGFQQMMRTFLDTQHQVVSTYLQTRTGGAVPAHPGFEEEPGPVKQSVAGETLPVKETGTGEKELSIAPETEDEPTAIDLEKQLLQIVSERTGYPMEMVGLDSDLEAELGIDSIKKVEITGAFGKLFAPEDLPDMESVRTLRQMLERVGNANPEAPAMQVSPEETVSEVAERAEQATIPQAASALLSRCRIVAKARPLPEKEISLTARKTIIITEDGLGVAEILAMKLLECRYSVVIMRSGDAQAGTEWTEYSLNDLDESGLARILGNLQDELGGIVHLLPLRFLATFQETSAGQLYKDSLQYLRPLFYLLQGAEQALRKDGENQVMTVTSLGGRIGTTYASGQSFAPLHGALNGFMKTLALEWPEVRCKAVDIALPCDAGRIADILFAEMSSGDDTVEVGWEGEKRYGMSMRPASLPSVETVIPEQDWVIIVTGGARGITSHITREIGRRYKPTLLLVGRSPLPADEEDDFLAGLESAQEVKQALIRKAKEANQEVTIPEVEAECRAIMSAKDIRLSLSELRKTGSTVHYHSLDVSDENVFTVFLEDIRERYGRLDGVVHGAGVIEDKLFSDKNWESFERVFATKVVSTLVLAKILPSFSPKFFFMFSSVAGVFGNRGQCDYAAANEVMNKTATWLEPHLGGNVAALNWGPWAGSGMATSEVQEQFKKRGVDLVDRERGVEAFMREMTSGKQPGAAVLLGDGPWVKNTNDEIIGSGLPLLETGRIVKHTDTALNLRISLDTKRHQYLRDHCLDDNPVFPMAMAIELMAEAAAFLLPGKRVCALRDIRVLKGIVVDKESVDITVHLEEQESDGDNVQLAAEIKDADNVRIFYRGYIELGDENVGADRPTGPALEGLEKTEMSCQELYEKWLFHGPLFQCIAENHGVNNQGMKALLTPSDSTRCLKGDGRGSWLLDPVVIDGGFQLALIWGRVHKDITSLPASIKALTVYEPFASGNVLTCLLEKVDVINEQTITYNIYLLDTNRQVVGEIERLEFVGSKELNRLVKSTTDT